MYNKMLLSGRFFKGEMQKVFEALLQKRCEWSEDSPTAPKRTKQRRRCRKTFPASDEVLKPFAKTTSAGTLSWPQETKKPSADIILHRYLHSGRGTARQRLVQEILQRAAAGATNQKFLQGETENESREALLQVLSKITTPGEFGDIAPTRANIYAKLCLPTVSSSLVASSTYLPTWSWQMA